MDMAHIFVGLGIKSMIKVNVSIKNRLIVTVMGVSVTIANKLRMCMRN